MQRGQGLTLTFYTTFHFRKYISNFTFHLKILLSKMTDLIVAYHIVSYSDLCRSSLDPPIWGECENAVNLFCLRQKTIVRWLSFRFTNFCTHFILLKPFKCKICFPAQPNIYFPDWVSILVHNFSFFYFPRLR